MKSWLQNNYIEMYSTHNEGKSVATERFIRTLNNKIYKHMTSVSKNMYIDKIDDTVNKFTNTYHSTIKMTPADVHLNTYFYFKKENNKDDFRFKVDNHVRISKHKNTFAKGYTPKRSDDVFGIKNVKNIVPYVIRDHEGKKVLECFTKTNRKKQRKSRRVKKQK